MLLADQDARQLTNPAQPSPLLARIFGANVASAELRGGADERLIYREEAAYTTKFAAIRLAEFAAGRLCARRALADLGIDDSPVAVNPDRSPRWPPSVVGSISHTGDYCCAVAAREHVFAGIGVDAEIVGRVTAELFTLVFTETERAFLSLLTADERKRATTIIFSAKEAFYKCQYPVTRRWIDFHDVFLELVTTDLTSGTFRVHAAPGRTAVAQSIHVLPQSGRFVSDGELVVTGMTLVRPGQAG